MATNVFETLPSGDVTAIPPNSAPVAAYEYKDGQRTETQLRDLATQLPIWRLRDAKAEIDGNVYDGVTLEILSATEPKIEAKGLTSTIQLTNPLLRVTARATGNGFAQLVIAVRGELKQATTAKKEF